jgi:DNA repair protein RadC
VEQLSIFQQEKACPKKLVKAKRQNLARFVELKMVCAERTVPYDAPITKPENAAALGEIIIGDSDREKAVVISLDTKLAVNAVEIVMVGSATGVPVHPREVFKGAVLANAVGIIFIHNHPSGDVTASPEDIAITKRLVKAGNLLGIDVLDHIIIGGNGRFASLRKTRSDLFGVEDNLFNCNHSS